jgi:hypothetical protein
MELTTPNILTGIALLGAIAHVMIFMNGFWNDVFFLSAILVVSIPVIVSKYLKTGKKSRRLTSMHKDI